MTVLAHLAPLAVRDILPRLRLPEPGLRAIIAAVPTSIAQAYRMAYVEPFKTRERQPLTLADADLEGRDPNW